jgi:hypothetical protein
MFRFFAAILVVVSPLLLSSCADTDSQGSQGDRVSSIPWNRPEKWESQGMIPGMPSSQ